MAQLKRRFLHQDVARNYTEHPKSAAWGEPEAVPEADQERMSKAARDKWQAEHAEKIARRKAATWLRRLAAAESVALARGFDISMYQARIHGEIQKLEREVDARERKAKVRDLAA